MSFTSRTPVNDNPDRVTQRRGFVTRHQVTGWRFAMRRIASGLALRDTRMLTDPLRAQSRSVAVGVLVVITGLVGCFIFSLIRPGGSVGDSAVVADRASSALYVRVDDQLHPVLNLASARLIVQKPVEPKAVGSASLDKLARGVAVGIPGAPERMVQNGSRDADWAVCDSAGTSYPGVTVIAGPLGGGGERASDLPADRAILVAAGGPPEAPTATWLIWGGRRSVIDLADRAVTDALGLGPDLPVAQAIAPGLFNAIPEGQPLRGPVVPGAGSPPQFVLSVPVPVGAVVTAYGTDNAMLYYAVLPDGLQQVPPPMATLLRNANSYGLQQPPRIGVDEVARAPVSRMLDVTAFPDRRIELIDTSRSPVMCVRWTKPADANSSSMAVLSGAALPLADGVIPVDFPGLPDATTAARVAVPVGRGYLVQTVGQWAAAPPTGSMFWVSDTGMRFGIEAANPDELAKTVAALGLAQPAVPIPWSVLTLFAAGPTLSKNSALTAFTGMEKR